MTSYYLILSEGAYSDYSPTYYVGNREISKEELDTKGIEIGDKIIQEFESAPTRPHVHTWERCCSFGPVATIDKYDPITLETIPSSPSSTRWFKLMEKWVLEQGFEKLPDKIPEINVSYSDFPSSLEP